MRGFVSLFLFLMTCLILNKESVQGVKRKFAPPYCRQLRFNCQRDSHADHICCKFPLPEGDEVEEAPKRPLIAIRPFLAGQRPFIPGKKEATPEKEESEEVPSDGQIVESNDQTTTTTTAAPPSTKSNRRGSSPNNKSQPGINKSSKPRICQRITANCEENPSHRCCQYQNNSVEAPATPVTTTTTTTTTQAPPEYEEYEYKGDYVEYGDPQQRIPAECFTAQFDCPSDPSHPCCAF